MRRMALIGATAVALVVAAGCAGPQGGSPEARLVSAPVASRSGLRTITGVGTGEVRGTPDTLTLELGVESRGESASAALRRSSEQIETVLGVLTDAGVSRDDIQTSGLSLSPEFDKDGVEIVGYVASNSVSVVTHDLDGAGGVIDAAAGAAGDDIRVDGVWFSIEDTSELVKAAREEAVQRAGQQAGQLAHAAGVELAAIQSIEEQSSPVYAAEADAGRGAGDSAVPIEPGTQELTVSVTVVYLIA